MKRVALPAAPDRPDGPANSSVAVRAIDRTIKDCFNIGVLLGGSLNKVGVHYGILELDMLSAQDALGPTIVTHGGDDA